MKLRDFKRSMLIASVICLLSGQWVFAQKKTIRPTKHGSVYFSWGYNTAWYTKSTVGVKQPSLGNDYKMVKVNGHDNKGWNYRLLNQELTIPQYNYRLGYYFNSKQDLAIEINFDHVKYIIEDNQQVRLNGKLNNVPTDQNITFSRQNGFYYYLNNGANFLLFNLVKRKNLYSTNDRKLYVDFTGKAGVGPVIPHVENSFFGRKNDKGFQIGGWNAGVETALRVTFMRYVYLEFAQKVDYARYSNLKVYEGRASQSFGTYELVLSLGAILPTSKNNPLFTAIAPKPETIEVK